MANEFDTGINKLVGQGAYPVQPVEDNTTANAIHAFGNLAIEATGSVVSAKIAGDNLKLKQHQGSAIASFSSDMTVVSSAYRQHKITRSAAITRLRDIKNRYAHANPLISKDIISNFHSFMGTNGLGNIVQTGDEEDQAHQKLIGEAVEGGWAKYDDDEDTKDEAIEHMQSYNSAVRELDWTSKKLAYVNQQLTEQGKKLGLQSTRLTIAGKKISNSTAELTLEKAQLEHASQMALLKGVQAKSFQVDNQISDLLAQVGDPSTADPNTANQVTYKLEQLQNQREQLIKTIGIGAPASYVASLTGPIEDKISAAKEYISGKITAQQYTNQVNNFKHKAVLLATRGIDDKTRKAIGASQLVTNADPQVTRVMDHIIISSILQGENDPKTVNPKDRVDPVVPKGDSAAAKDFGDYSKFMIGVARKANIGTLTPEQETRYGNEVSNLFAGLKENGSKITSPSELNGVMTLLASPEMHEWAMKHPDQIKQADSNGVSNLIHRQYIQNIKPVVMEEWKKANTFTGKLNYGKTETLMVGKIAAPQRETVKTTDIIKPTFQGGGVVFEPIDPSVDYAVKAAQDLNNSVSPVLNKTIKAVATLEGTDNYRKVYTDAIESWFKPEDDNGQKSD